MVQIHPDWVPRLDGPVGFARVLLSTNDLTRFERRGIYAAMVLIASSVGRHSSILEFVVILLISLD